MPSPCTYELMLAMHRINALFSSSKDLHNSEILLPFITPTRVFQYLSTLPAFSLAIAFPRIPSSSLAFSVQFINRELIKLVWSDGFCWISRETSIKCWIWMDCFLKYSGASCKVEHKMERNLTIASPASASWIAVETTPRTSRPDIFDQCGFSLNMVTVQTQAVDSKERNAIVVFVWVSWGCRCEALDFGVRVPPRQPKRGCASFRPPPIRIFLVNSVWSLSYALAMFALSPNSGEDPQGWILKALTRLLLRSHDSFISHQLKVFI